MSRFVHNLVVLLWLVLATGTSWAADTKKTTAPGDNDLSRYTAAMASPGGQTILRDASGRTAVIEQYKQCLPT
jgi:hypothetical protein